MPLSGVTSIHEASAAALLLPQSIEVLLSDGRQVSLRRLSWLHFEALWQELAGLLAPLLEGGSADRAELTQALLAAPACLLRLCSLGSGIPESELAQRSADDVLALSAASIELNFIQGAGLRSFFASAAQLSV
ncbi:hypothetical protein IT575_01175 [bacterium]|nr:hypothetical protein [bacterium]